MAEAEPSNGIASEDRGGSASTEAYSGVAGDEFVTTLASTSSCDELSGRYVTAGMSALQIETTIEKSRAQGWSELVSDRAGDGASAASSGRSVDDQLLWEELKQRYPRTFRDLEDGVKLGRVIAEGGQSVIYEASWDGEEIGRSWVAKVFKMEGFSLAYLQRQWPLVSQPPLEGDFVLGAPVFDDVMRCCCGIRWGTYLKDGRFAFLMGRYWGDLRTLINLKMSDTNSQGPPPFSQRTAVKIISEIASGMESLHERGVLHRDFKAANVLIGAWGGDPRYDDYFYCHLADYESSMLVGGTGFWRAPEVLEHLLKKPCDRGDVDKTWTEKSDVYSFAMTCYEVWTGHTPFFGYEKMDWKRIIDGERPHLPDYIPPEARELLERCWHKEPSDRPTIRAIAKEVNSILWDLPLEP